MSHISAATHSSLPGAFLTNAPRFPGTLVLRHGHAAESCCPPVSGDSAPTRRNAATFLVHPVSTAIFMCPTQSQEHGFQKNAVYFGQMHFASFLLLSAVWCQGRSFSQLHIRYKHISNFCQPLWWSCISSLNWACISHRFGVQALPIPHQTREESLQMYTATFPLKGKDCLWPLGWWRDSPGLPKVTSIWYEDALVQVASSRKENDLSHLDNVIMIP